MVDAAAAETLVVDGLTVDEVLRERARRLNYGRGVLGKLRLLTIDLGLSHRLVGELSDEQLSTLSAQLRLAAEQERREQAILRQRKAWEEAINRISRGSAPGAPRVGNRNAGPAAAARVRGRPRRGQAG
jgi:hypothetical protein